MPETRENARERWRIAEPLLLGLAALFFAVLTRYHWGQICDDAFIVFRYADNVAAGVGPVWNRGERVEGFSSPLWLGLMVVGKVLGADLPVRAAGLGVGFSALCLVLVHRLAFALSRSRIVAAAACAASALLAPSYYWAPAGLETALFATLVTGAAWSLAAPSTWRWVPVAALLCLARPEGPLLACALGGMAGLAHGRQALRPGRVVLALGPGLAWLGFRLAYFGAWLPNTYYAKATGALLSRLESGLIYSMWALAALVATAATMWVAGIVHRKSLAAGALAVLELAIVVAAGGDWMWHGRMLVSVLPPLVAVAVAGIAHAPSRRRFVLVLVCVLGWSGFLPGATLIVDAFAGGRLPPTAYQEGRMVSAALAAAHFIAENYPAEALVAVNHAGALPHALPNPALDMTGLCDRHIARDIEGGLHQKFDAGYVLSRQPRLVVLNSRTRPGTAGRWYHPGYWAGETALFARPEFASMYRPVNIFWDWRWQGRGDSFILLFERISPGS